MFFCLHALYCKSRLVLSGDVELNPGPPNKLVNTSKTNSSSNKSTIPNAVGSNALNESTHHAHSNSALADDNLPSVSEMF